MHLQHISHNCHFNKLVFFTINFFNKLLNYFFMFQCDEHVEINKFLCSLSCTWMTIIDVSVLFF